MIQPRAVDSVSRNRLQPHERKTRGLLNRIGLFQVHRSEASVSKSQDGTENVNRSSLVAWRERLELNEVTKMKN